MAARNRKVVCVLVCCVNVKHDRRDSRCYGTVTARSEVVCEMNIASSTSRMADDEIPKLPIYAFIGLVFIATANIHRSASTARSPTRPLSIIVEDDQCSPSSSRSSGAISLTGMCVGQLPPQVASSAFYHSLADGIRGSQASELLAELQALRDRNKELEKEASMSRPLQDPRARLAHHLGLRGFEIEDVPGDNGFSVVYYSNRCSLLLTAFCCILVHFNAFNTISLHSILMHF